MRQPRAHTTQPLIPHTRIVLDADTSHYVTRVLRLKSGSELSVFNATDGEWNAVLESDNKKQATVLLIEQCENHNDSSLTIHLGLGLSRGERMDYAIQKATELGVTSITP